MTIPNPQLLPLLSRVGNANVRMGAAPSPTGLAALLQRPGLRDALLATGMGMMSQADQPGSVAGALGRALPMGVQAYQQSRQNAEMDALIAQMPPEMQKVLRMLPPAQKGQALMQLLQPKERKITALGKDERGVDEDGNVVVDVAPAAPVAPTAKVQLGGVTVDNVPLDQVTGVLAGLPQVPPEEMTPYQKEQIKLDRERLGLERERMARDAAGGVDPVALRKEFDSHPITKQTLSIAQSYQTILSAAQTPSAAGDLALIFNYMKMLDPGSSVREGEFANAQNAAGIPERVRAMYNNATKGERLTESTRADFIDRATKIARGQQQMSQGIAERYAGFARSAGVDPAAVVSDPFKMTGMQQEPVGPRAAPKTQGGKTLMELLYPNGGG
jgi:hypothetical protein